MYCDADLPEAEVLAGWCEACGKKVPETVVAGVRKSQAETRRAAVEQRSAQPPKQPAAQAKPERRTSATGSFWRTTTFHLPPPGGPEYDPRDVRTHKLVVAVGMIFGAAVLVSAVVGGTVLVVMSLFHPQGSTFAFIVVLLELAPLVLGLAAALYLFGTAVVLLFTPSSFLAGPIGKKWQGIVGIKGPFAARCVCFCLCALVIGGITLLVLSRR
jgi:hypothetical protein